MVKQREIKFRALVNSDKEQTMIQHREVIERAHLLFDDSLNNKDIVMQYTGLKDKNGKEIYDKDLIEIEYDGEMRMESVNFHNGCFWLTGFGELYPWTEQDGEVGGKDVVYNNTEVVGNIYEDQELIKKYNEE